MVSGPEQTISPYSRQIDRRTIVAFKSCCRKMLFVVALRRSASFFGEFICILFPVCNKRNTEDFRYIELKFLPKRYFCICSAYVSFLECDFYFVCFFDYIIELKKTFHAIFSFTTVSKKLFFSTQHLLGKGKQRYSQGPLAKKEKILANNLLNSKNWVEISLLYSNK